MNFQFFRNMVRSKILVIYKKMNSIFTKMTFEIFKQNDYYKFSLKKLN